MKKITLTSLLMLMMWVFAPSIQAQDTPAFAKQSVFLEGGGNSVFWAINYDRRLGNKPDGLGVRAGAGAVITNNTTIANFPVAANYLAGKNGKYFEAGLGACLIYSNLWAETEEMNTFGIITFGYRRQPEEGGFTYRIALTPIFGSLDGDIFFIPYLVGISGGYAF